MNRGSQLEYSTVHRLIRYLMELMLKSQFNLLSTGLSAECSHNYMYLWQLVNVTEKKKIKYLP